MNDNALLYSKHCEIQIVDSTYYLHKYMRLSKFKKDENILDIGCADGTVSLDVLVPKLSDNFRNVVLVDVAEKMVNFARKRCTDEKVDCVQLDISLDIPDKFKQYFDHIFSFYCLNCIGGEERYNHALVNIFDMLKPKGDIFFTIIVNTPYFDIWENMAKDEKWKHHLKDYKNYVCVYNYTKTPVEKLKNDLESVGFVVRECKFDIKCFVYTPDDFTGFSIAVDPFVKILPEDKVDDYINDFKAEFKKCNLIDFKNCRGEEKVYLTYTVLAVSAFKPL